MAVSGKHNAIQLLDIVKYAAEHAGYTTSTVWCSRKSIPQITESSLPLSHPWIADITSTRYSRDYITATPWESCTEISSPKTCSSTTPKRR